jgi:transcriptional regulator with XRE-family HTH domain
MDVGTRVRTLRQQQELSQGDLEARTGLLRCYISRIEHGHLIPSVETLEKLARAFDLKLYQLLYDGEEPPMPKPRNLSRKQSREFDTLHRLLPKISQVDREVLLFTAIRMVRSKKRRER